MSVENLSILVPYRPDNGWRDRGMEWTRKRIDALLPEAEVIVEGDDGGSNPGEFSQALAINRCAAKATRDVFLMLEACPAEPEWIHEAVELAEFGAAWVLPTHHYRTTQAATEALLAKPPDCEIGEPEADWIGDRQAWGGMAVYTREIFEKLGGYDERFTQWGSLDVCWASAMDTLVGEVRWHPGRSIHFWHPAPLGETYGNPEHQRQYALTERYKEAAGDPEAMRALVEEWRS